MPQMHRIPFHFRGGGHAISGEFRHPAWTPIPAQASASLPTIGGHATNHVENFQFQDFVSFKSAHTHVSGKHRKDDTYATHATVTVHGLNILGVVTADLIVCRLTAIYASNDPEGHITAEDSRFEGLKIQGEPVKVILRHDLLVKCKTFDELSGSIAPVKKSGRIEGVDTNRKVALCSLVEKIETKLKGVDAKQHVIKVENFGKIFLAEVFASPASRTLTMLRLELGSPHVAEIAGPETNTNGQPVPPSGN